MTASNDKALLALAELQIQSGDAAGAIETLNKAYASNGASWRTRYLLATAYAKTGKFRDAEMHAISSVKLARTNTATPLLLLGDIQSAAGRWTDAKQSWQRIVTDYPNSPEVGEARKKITDAAGNEGNVEASKTGTFSPTAIAPELPSKVEERPWAPPDVDSKEYSVAPGVFLQRGGNHSAGYASRKIPTGESGKIWSYGTH